MIDFLRSRLRSFGPAFEGWWYVLRTQQNAWIHALFSILAIFMSWWLQLERRDWVLILLIIGLVWMAEFINTALEAIVDLASPRNHPLAKVGKDIGAAAVLIAAISAVIVGTLVLGPPLWEKYLDLI